MDRSAIYLDLPYDRFIEEISERKITTIYHQIDDNLVGTMEGAPFSKRGIRLVFTGYDSKDHIIIKHLTPNFAFYENFAGEIQTYNEQKHLKGEDAQELLRSYAKKNVEKARADFPDIDLREGKLSVE